MTGLFFAHFLISVRFAVRPYLERYVMTRQYASVEFTMFAVHAFADKLTVVEEVFLPKKRG